MKRHVNSESVREIRLDNRDGTNPFPKIGQVIEENRRWQGKSKGRRRALARSRANNASRSR